jgi:hypothetical protein
VDDEDEEGAALVFEHAARTMNAMAMDRTRIVLDKEQQDIEEHTRAADHDLRDVRSACGLWNDGGDVLLRLGDRTRRLHGICGLSKDAGGVVKDARDFFELAAIEPDAVCLANIHVANARRRLPLHRSRANTTCRNFRNIGRRSCSTCSGIAARVLRIRFERADQTA